MSLPAKNPQINMVLERIPLSLTRSGPEYLLLELFFNDHQAHDIATGTRHARPAAALRDWRIIMDLVLDVAEMEIQARLSKDATWLAVSGKAPRGRPSKGKGKANSNNAVVLEETDILDTAEALWQCGRGRFAEHISKKEWERMARRMVAFVAEKLKSGEWAQWVGDVLSEKGKDVV
jgi:hypothetical protein